MKRPIDLQRSDAQRGLNGNARIFLRSFRRWLVSLRGRLVLVLAAALAPALALAIFQAKWSYDRERDAIMAQLGQIVLSASDDYKEIFLRAKNILGVLAVQPLLQGEGVSCEQMLRNALLSARDFANILYVDTQGRPLCSALPVRDLPPVPEEAWFQDLATTRDMVPSATVTHPQTGQAYLFTGQGMFSVDGRFAGALLVAINLDVLERLPRHAGVPIGGAVGLIDAQGRVIAGTRHLNASPAQLAQAISARLYRFVLTGGGGNVTLYALAPLLEGRLFAVTASEQESLLAWTQLDLIGRIVFPVVTLALALAIIGFGGHYLVLRWLSYLRRLAQAYSHGAFHIDTSTAMSAPTEFQEVVQTLAQMAARLDKRERDLTLAVEQRDAMLKEIHHRVKNNLQVVTSLLSIEAGRSNGAGDALIRARARVIAFAQIHQWLYEKENFAVVSLASFLRDYCGFVHETFGGEERNVQLKIDAAEIDLPLDTAIPLALFILEVQTDAYLHAFADHKGGTLAITTRRIDEGWYELKVEENGQIARADGHAHETSLSLMRGFSRQIGGVLEIMRRDSGGTALSLKFPAPADVLASRRITS